MFMIFDSIANALEHLCCVDNWKWEGSSSYDGLCEWAYENAREETYQSECENPKTDKRWIYQIISDYLTSGAFKQTTLKLHRILRRLTMYRSFRLF